MTQVHSYLKAIKMRVGLLLILVRRAWVFVKREKEPRDFTKNLFFQTFLKFSQNASRKEELYQQLFLPSVKTFTKKHSHCFSFSTGFLFVKKKKCCVIWWL